MMSERGTPATPNDPLTDDDLSLPLQVITSETIPPSPNRSGSTIDCLLDYSGFSWLAYGASSLLVISHFPSPLSPQQTLIGRQVMELSNHDDSTVTSLAWSPSLPSHGDIAVAVDNFIYLCSPSTQGSFHWIQIAVLVQEYDIDAIKWTGSGDGVISVGAEVVLWKGKCKSWEIAWKFTHQHPQSMVSPTWSIEGPVATGTLPSTDKEASKIVSLCNMDDKSGLLKSELKHPQSVSMIQWRPSVTTHSRREVLLTCCLDGTARLWSEVDSGKTKNSKQSFYVIAVVEVNQSLTGTLGTDIFLAWPTEMTNISDIGGVQLPCDHDRPGRCEWLIGYGPCTSLTFWAIHCLDDIAPLRFPRVTLWKTLDLAGTQGQFFRSPGNLNSEDHSLFVKAVISRGHIHGPPFTCSLFQLLSDNSLGWTHLNTLEFSKTQGESLCLDGHNGDIVQVAIHPYSCEIEYAVSLDSNGLLLFWCLPTISGHNIGGMPALFLPTWNLVGKLETKKLFSMEYSCLRWAPLVMNGYSVLLLGHSVGIDCLMIELPETSVERIVHHKLGTIPFASHIHADGPTKIFASPLPSTCRISGACNHFMLLGLWMNEFQALSWRVTLHSADISGSSSDCHFKVQGDALEFDRQGFETFFADRRYCLVAEPCSSELPDSHNCDQVTTVAMVSPGSLLPSVQQKWPTSNGLCSNFAPFHMVSGHADGRLRFWTSGCPKLPTACSELSYLRWELVGMLKAHKGPVTAICLSCYGGKIATTSMENYQENIGTLCIWQSVRIVDAGNFLLEDKISLNGDVVSLSWLSIGNGQLLLGVCLKNELRLYAQKSYRSQPPVNSGTISETSIWHCIAAISTSLDARDFFWGPGATPVLVYKKHFGLLSRWLFHRNKKNQSTFHVQCSKANTPSYMSGTNSDFVCTVVTDCNICNELSLDGVTKKCLQKLPPKLNVLSTMIEQQCESHTKNGLCSILDVAGRLRGSMPIYHPEALLLNLYSGNWRRACVAVRHFVQYLKSDSTSAAREKAIDSRKSNGIIPQICLSKYLVEQYSTGLSNKESPWGRDLASVSSAALFQITSIDSIGYSEDANGSRDAFNSGSEKSEISSFAETIHTSNDITAITSTEIKQMLALIDLLAEISDLNSSSAYESLDESGRRFWVELRFQQLHFLRKFGGSAKTNDLVVDPGLIGWAFQSDCQEILMSSFLSHEPSWQEMRNLGVGYWFTNATQLRARMEKLARSQYLKKKDPKDCALLYIALNRLQVLAGLFKISRDEKDKPLVGFLSRNFQDEKNKGAALKNAYVLMGRHQLELAIAFFLLGGDTTSAVSVCAKTLGDEQLALVICRLIEGNGGSLERHLISKFLLPAAIEKGDCWLASVFEWTLGNFVQSYLRLLCVEKDSLIVESGLPLNRAALLDPKVGQYCLLLAKKTFMKNYIGESSAVVLARWAALMASIALNRRGFLIEALQCISSSLGTMEGKDEKIHADSGHHGLLNGILEESYGSSNWLAGDVALHVEYIYKLDLALHYISTLVEEHPSWTNTNFLSLKPLVCKEEYRHHHYNLSLGTFQKKLYSGLATLEKKYSLKSVEMLNMILFYSCNYGTSFIGYHLLHGYTSLEFPRDENHTYDCIFQYPPLPKLYLKAAEEVSYFFARYLMCCSILYPPLNPSFLVNKVLGLNRAHWLNICDVYMERSIHILESLRDTLKMYCPTYLTEDPMMETFTVIDVLQYCIVFASAWLQKNLRCLILTIYPILVIYEDGRSASRDDVQKLKIDLSKNLELMSCDSSSDNVNGSADTSKQGQHELSGDLVVSISDDEKWQILGACLWRHLLNFTRDVLKSFPDSLADNSSFESLHSPISSSLYANGSSYSNGKKSVDTFAQLPRFFAKLLDNTLSCISSSHAKQLASVLILKMEKGFPVPTLEWLGKSDHSRSSFSYGCLNQDIDKLIRNESKASLFRVLWEMSVDPAELCKAFENKSLTCLQSFRQKLSKGWSDVQKVMQSEYGEVYPSNDDEKTTFHSSSNLDDVSPTARRSQDNSGYFKSRHKGSTLIKEETYFQNPDDIYKRTGELLEAVCINSTNQKQVAVASNKKGILFFRWDDELSKDHSQYIWSVADWPRDGWAGSESTPIPTFVSPGIGLGNKKGAQLGLGGATIGQSSLLRSRRNLTGHGALGVPGYGGVDPSGLGWGAQDDFEFVDPPATVDNISTRALSSHPSRPFLLAGSSNTHIYLWEFGKEKATATYGVLPAANVPPPYALASIEALRFDRCGHRFVTAALDGTICTWQLEVGGRSNIRPTESALCFNRHALDVTYVAASGSVVAASGYSSDNVNVVIWDTLAPTTTSQASLMCHEGGARSVSVFDNNFGSGSISPLIVTGGKGGDVGLHDFRFIATGKTKRHRQSNNNEHKSNYSFPHEPHAEISNRYGEQNTKGMLWYIPKAHLGCITRIATIPDTSFFLTGSKDGDVKLWDAKKSELVFHWPKLHERHTFLQPSSRGFGGIVRAAVTDIQVISQGFLTCGGDGTVKMVQIKNFPHM